jgi:hypothetical protein
MAVGKDREMPRQHYTLYISATWPIRLQEGDDIPDTPEALQRLYEACAVDPYDFDNLTLRLEPGDVTGKYAALDDNSMYRDKDEEA